MVAADHESHTLAGPFAMDAVTDAERVAFTAHLADCEPCRTDVREMREATARLGLAAAVRPRPELREQTIRAAYRTSQLAPFQDEATADAQRASEPGGAAAARRAFRWVLGLRAPVRIGLAAATALVATAAVLGVVTSDMMSALHHSQRQDHLIAAVLTAPDVVKLTAAVTTGGTATVYMSHREHAAVVGGHDLVPLPSTEAYEIWLMGPAGTRPAGMLKPQRGGMAGPAVIRGLRPADMIGLSVEPMAGSSRPTSSFVVLIKPQP